MQAIAAAWQFKILRQPFVQPKRKVGNHRVQIAMSHLVPQVIANVLAPMSENAQVRVALNEESPTLWKQWKVLFQILLETLFIVKQVNVDWFIRNRQQQPLSNIAPPRRQLIQQPVTSRQAKVAEDSQLFTLELIIRGQGNARTQSSASTNVRQPDGQRKRHDCRSFDQQKKRILTKRMFPRVHGYLSNTELESMVARRSRTVRGGR